MRMESQGPRENRGVPETQDSPVIKASTQELPQVLLYLHDVERALRRADFTRDPEERKRLHNEAIEKGVNVVTSDIQTPVKKSLDRLAEADPDLYAKVNQTLIKSCMLDYDLQKDKKLIKE